MTKPKKPTKAHLKKINNFLNAMEIMFGVQTYDRTFTVKEEDRDDLAATINVQEDYRRIKICIYPCFFEASLKQQAAYLLHEFCHYLTDPLNDFSHAVMKGQFQTDEHRRIALEKSTSMVTELAGALLEGRFQSARKVYHDYSKK